jgi:hypothetical protein
MKASVRLGAQGQAMGTTLTAQPGSCNIEIGAACAPAGLVFYGRFYR